MKTPPVLYHYTSMNALFEILKKVESRDDTIRLRATHASFMNDPKEYQYFMECVVEILREEGLFSEDEEPELWSYLKRHYKIMDMLDSEPVIFSLSESRDSLPMWQAYGQRGQGIAIAFASHNLEELKPAWNLEECCYDVAEDIKKNIDVDEIKACFSRDTRGDLQLDINKLRRPTQKSRAKFKHPAYHYEREWRMVQYMPKEYEFRESRGLIIPYKEIEIPVSAVIEVMIGPTAYPNLSVKSLHIFLESRNISFNLLPSAIPYTLLGG